MVVSYRIELIVFDCNRGLSKSRADVNGCCGNRWSVIMEEWKWWVADRVRLYRLFWGRPLQATPASAEGQQPQISGRTRQKRRGSPRGLRLISAVRRGPRKHCAQDDVTQWESWTERNADVGENVFCSLSSSLPRQNHQPANSPACKPRCKKDQRRPHHITTQHINQTPSRRMMPGSLFPSSHPIAFPLSHLAIPS